MDWVKMIIYHNNPISNDLFVTLDKPRNINLTIYSIIGQQVLMETNINKPSFNINLDYLSSGVYFLKIIDTQSNELFTSKIVKE